VAPETQVVGAGQGAEFVLSVSNSGEEDLVDVVVDSSVDACDVNIGELAVGEDASYTCKAGEVAADVEVTFAVTGVAANCAADAAGNAQATVGFVLPVSVVVVPSPQQPTISIRVTPPLPPPPPSVRVTTTTTPAIPSGVPTGTGDDATHRVPVGVLTVIGFGIAAIAAGTYRVTRREE
jgi:hypothetical protein